MQTPNTPPPQGTLAKDLVQFWLCAATEDGEKSDLLWRMFLRRNETNANKDALGSAASLMNTETVKSVRDLIRAGGLLFLGQPKALAVAKQAQAQKVPA